MGYYELYQNNQAKGLELIKKLEKDHKIFFNREIEKIDREIKKIDREIERSKGGK